MTPAKPKPRQSGTRSARIGALLGALLALGLLAASPAQALTLEQTGTFAGSVDPPAEPGVFPEEVQLGGVSGMAVNVDGAGGVSAGTVYGAGLVGADLWIARYEPDGESMKFVGAWQVLSAPGPYKQCGPGGPNCAAPPESRAGVVDVDVDQTTGNVYAFNGEISNAGAMLVTVFKPDGSEEITRFGENAADGKTTAETPGQIHASASVGGIAVNGDGEVYVFDLNHQDNFYHRLMVFKPKTPGNYEEYEYAGQAADIGAGFLNETEFPSRPVTDSAGDIYVAGEDYVEKYDPDQPAAPICSFDFNKGGITAITVDPTSGAPFFYTYKDKKVHQLSPCDGGKFVEVGPLISVAPERAELSAFAFDPKRQLTSRPAGVLYGGAPSAQPGSGAGQPGRGSLGYIFAGLVEKPPVVESESVAHVTETGAELQAQINPKGFETSYVFQYLTEVAYQEGGESFSGASEAPPGGAVLGAGQAAIAAATSLSGLKADTAYRYRAVATSNCSPAEPGKVCEVVGPAQSFRTLPFEAPGLPDNRAYELVSPVQKNGGQVLPADPEARSCVEIECKPGSAYQPFPRQSTADGGAIVYEGTPFDGQGAVIENQYIAHRDPKAGWQTTNLTPPLLESKDGGKGYKAFNPELTEGLLEQTAPSLSPEAPLDYTNLYRQPTTDPLSLDPLLREAPPNRLPGNAAGQLRLRYAGGSTDLSRLFFEANDALTPDALDGGVSKNNLYEWSGDQLQLVNLLPGDTETVLGAVFGSGTLLKSGNDSTPAPVFSHAISDDGSRVFWSSEAGQVYVRIDGVETRKIEASGKFLSASADGSKLLLDEGCLYDLQSEACEDLTQGKGGFEGIAGQSEDLSHIYFADTGVLDEAPNEYGDVAEAGKLNLYAWVEGATAFVATLLPADNDPSGNGDWQASPSIRTAQASPGGRFVAFLSSAPLNGYDNTGPCQPDNEGGMVDGPCQEAFLYDSVTGELRCVSCNPTNARPLGRSVLRLIKGGANSAFQPQPRYLTDSGRLYFDSQDSLVLADTNEGIEDVYQYEPEGVGSCKRAGGCVSLISAGRESADSNLLAIDETGKSVFFTTRDRLKQKDKDELYDLYVAREGGGIAAETETTRSECQGEACQPAAFEPDDPTPSSSGFQGSGNVKQGTTRPRCPKGRKQVQRKGKPRCVKRKRARAANRNRGGAK